MPGCLPPGSNSSASWCAEETCDGTTAGCPAAIQLGAVTWDITDGTPPALRDVSLQTEVVSIESSIPVVLGTSECIVTVSVPEGDSVPVTALGQLVLGTDGTTYELEFQSVDADLSNLNLDSANALCSILVNMSRTELEPSFESGIVDALQARANALRCLDCREDCAGGIACVSSE